MKLRVRARCAGESDGFEARKSQDFQFDRNSGEFRYCVTGAGSLRRPFLLVLAGLSLTEASGVTNLRATVIRVLTPDGTLVVEVDDPELIRRSICGDAPYGARVGDERSRRTAPRPPKEKWQSTRSGSHLVPIREGCKNLAHQGLWHELFHEGGGEWVQVYYVAVGSLAVWQSPRWAHRWLAAKPR